MVSVYKIYDSQDNNYAVWYGDIDDIINYIEEIKQQENPDYDYYEQLTNGKSWNEELINLGLSFDEIYNKSHYE